MIFNYKAQNRNGEIITKTIEAVDRISVIRQIKEDGLIPIFVKEILEKKNNISFSFSFFNKVSIKDKMIFAKNLSGMLSAGLSLIRALSVLEKQIEKNTEMKKIVNEIILTINQGGAFSSGIEKFPKVFPPVFSAMVRAGEESGGLPKALSEVYEILFKTYDLNRKIKGALIYPTVILTAIILVGILMMIFIVPTLTKTFTELNIVLPATTRAIIYFSNFLLIHPFLSFGIVVFFITFFLYLMRLKKVRIFFDYFILKLPIIGLIAKETNTARTARAMSSLLSSGVQMTRSLEITKDIISNTQYKSFFDRAILAVQKGESLSDQFESRTDIYPIMIAEMAQVGEETGAISSSLSNVAIFFEEEVDSKTKNISTIIEPILMVLVGSAVGIFAVSMISPLYSIMDKIK